MIMSRPLVTFVVMFATHMVVHMYL